MNQDTDTAGPPQPKDQPTQLADQAPDDRVRELEAQVQRLTDLAARAQADLQNAKARMERDAREIRQFATESVLLKLLPTVDNFQRAFEHLPAELAQHHWVKGIEATEQELLRGLGELGLRRMEPMGQTIDAARHEVLMTGPGAENTVVKVLENGYELHGKVIRPARVQAGDGSDSHGTAHGVPRAA